MNNTIQNGIFDLSNAVEACKIINRTSEAPLWIRLVRETCVSEDQGERILDEKLITKCRKCKESHCEFVTCYEKNITEVNCTAVFTKEIPESDPQKIDIKFIIGPAIAAFVVGTAIIILSILCRRKKRQSKTKEVPSTTVDTEVLQKRRKFSNKYTRFTKDDIRHLGHSNPSHVITYENDKEQENHQVPVRMQNMTNFIGQRPEK